MLQHSYLYWLAVLQHARETVKLKDNGSDIDSDSIQANMSTGSQHKVGIGVFGCVGPTVF